MSFQQHDNHLRNAAHYDKLLKSYALKLSKAREIASETLEGMNLFSCPQLSLAPHMAFVIISAEAKV